MSDVMTDDMTIGNPALLVTRRRRWPRIGALGLFPGVHIAQLSFRVIANCGVNVRDAMQQSKAVKIGDSRTLDENEELNGKFRAANSGLGWELPV
jgi:hypothetical protein